VHDLPQAGFTHLPTGHSGLAVHFSATAGATTYHWDFGDGRYSALHDPLHHFDAPGDQEVCLTTTNAVGCANTTCHVVRVQGSDDVWMPSAFSPDGDGINEKLLPVIAMEGLVHYHFSVFDRWGGLLFETHAPTEGWDGTAQSQPMGTGVYVWRLEWSVNGNARAHMGQVTVLR
jgi:gliding motility-associated-like protein